MERCETVRRIYPDWLTKPYSENAHNLAETLGRIADRTDAWAAEKQEMRLALAWCRENGNPHQPKETTHD